MTDSVGIVLGQPVNIAMLIQTVCIFFFNINYLIQTLKIELIRTIIELNRSMASKSRSLFGSLLLKRAIKNFVFLKCMIRLRLNSQPTTLEAVSLPTVQSPH